MAKYFKEINGVLEFAETGNGTILIGDNWVSNPTDEMLVSDGWEVWTPPQRTLEEIKKDKIKLIEDYDSSPNVNEFLVGEDKIWLDKNTRVGLSLRFSSELDNGISTTTLWYGNDSYTLPTRIAVQMLKQIELYASACYDRTALHKKNVMELSTVQEVNEYDYRIGYPEKLRFSYDQQQTNND